MCLRENAFARAAATHHDYRFAGRNVEIDAVEHLLAAERLLEPADLDHDGKTNRKSTFAST